MQNEICSHIDASTVGRRLAKLTPGSVVTQGSFEVEYEAQLADAYWGVFDLLHRQYVHNTYPNFIQVLNTKNLSVLLTPWGKLPIYFQVVTARTGENDFMQSFSVFGVLHCHQVSRMRQVGDKTVVSMDWYVVSHWLLKWLHRPFNARLLKLQRVQSDEDIPLRARRSELRRRGLTFDTDTPDFLIANQLNDHVRLPKTGWPASVALDTLPMGERTRVTLGTIELIVARAADGGVEIWPGLCPHEGAAIECKHIKDGIASCPWHGRKFGATKLGGDGDGFSFLDLRIELRGGKLVAERRIDG